MNRDELDKTLEEWLDRAAADYGKSDIRPGFEARIIANLNSTPKEENKRIPWIAVLATATAILILVVGGTLLTKFQSPDKTQIALTKPARTASAFRGGAPRKRPPEVIGKEAKGGSVSARPSIQKPKEIGKEHFLSSQLTDQERYLLVYARIVSPGILGEVEKSEFTPTEIPPPSVPSLYVPELKSFSVENKDLQIPKLQNEEQL
jgi:hypothetical protein